MAFQKYGSLKDNGSPVLLKVILTNSIAAVVMDSVKAASGFLALGTAGALVLGHIDSMVTKEGNGLLTTGVAGSEIGSYAGAWTASASNQTVAKVAALVDVSKETLYSATPDATIGTTTGSNLFGNHTDIVSEDTIDEDNGGTVTTATAQYTILGVSRDVATRGVYAIYESQIFGV